SSHLCSEGKVRPLSFPLLISAPPPPPRPPICVGICVWADRGPQSLGDWAFAPPLICLNYSFISRVQPRPGSTQLPRSLVPDYSLRGFIGLLALCVFLVAPSLGGGQVVAEPARPAPAGPVPRVSVALPRARDPALSA